MTRSTSTFRVVAAAVLLLCVSVGHAAEITQRIVGGNVAQEGAYPWMSWLSITPSSGSFSYFCGGTLVGKQWVLTAAHCVNKVVGVPTSVYQPSEIAVFPGLFDLTQRNAVGPVEVVEVVVHPGFRFGSGGEPVNDAALLKLSTPQNLPTLAIADSPVMAAIAPGDLLTVIGWGNRAADGSDDFPTQLHEVGVPLVAQSDCRNTYGGGTITNSMLCAGPVEGGKDACQGDSGGPLLYRDGVAWKQVGVVSFGEGCAQSGFPGVYSRTSSFLGWIEQVINVIEHDVSLDFSYQPPGFERIAQAQFFNSGDENLAVNSIALDDAAFSVVDESCTANTLFVGSQCEVSIRLLAASVGGKGADLLVEVEGRSRSVLKTALTATILAEQSFSSVLDNNALEWFSGGGQVWGADSNRVGPTAGTLRSGRIGDGRSSVVLTVVEGPGRLVFDWRVSSEEGFDFLIWYVDGEEQGRISGEQGWVSVAGDILAGAHDVRWEYRKDAVVSAGKDAAWLNAVRFSGSPAVRTAVQSPSSPSGGGGGGGGASGWFVLLCLLGGGLRTRIRFRWRK